MQTEGRNMFSEEKGGCPSILVIAGPNGSGKSTVTKGLPIIGIYVNADEIKKAAKCSDMAAAQEAEMIRRSLLEARKESLDSLANGLLRRMQRGCDKKHSFVICAENETASPHIPANQDTSQGRVFDERF